MQPETSFARVPDTALTASDPPLLYPEYVGTRLRAPKDPLVVLPTSALGADRVPCSATAGSTRRTPT